MQAVKRGKIRGAFAPDDIAYDIDRASTATQEPSLAEMTAKAIEWLTAADRRFL